METFLDQIKQVIVRSVGDCLVTAEHLAFDLENRLAVGVLHIEAVTRQRKHLLPDV